MSSPNFGFLSPSFALLAQLGSTAEAYAALDPNAALLKLRQFGEILARHVAERVHLELDGSETQHDRIRMLGRAGYLPRSIRDDLHALRMAGNSAAHRGAGTQQQAMSLVQVAFRVARWFRAAHAPFIAEPPELYRPVARQADPIEGLRREVEDLRRLLAEATTDEPEISPVDLTAELEQLLTPHRKRYESELNALREEIHHLRITQTAKDAPRSEASEQSGIDATCLATPECNIPGCGAPMTSVLASKAVPTRGIAVGDQIWRCSRYPECKGWVPARPDGPGGKPSRNSTTAVKTPTALPRRAWVEYGIRTGWAVNYLNCGGRLRSTKLTDALDTRERYALSQTAVFCSDALAAEAISESSRFVGGIIRRILGRGILPPVDPDVEEHILDAAGLLRHAKRARHPGDLSRVLDASAPVPRRELIAAAVRHREPFRPDLASRMPNGAPLVHEDAELPLLRDWVSKRLGSAGHWWHPQASLDALGERPGNTGRRLDFLYATPDGAFAVEVDGDQHNDSVDVDAARDAALERRGIHVLRIPAEEARSGAGPALKKLAATSPAPRSDRLGPDVLLLIWGPVVAHRITLAITEALERGWLSGACWRLELQEPLGIAVPAVRAAVEMIAATAAVWGADVSPESVMLESDGRRATLRRDQQGRYKPAPTSGLSTPADPVRITVEPFHGPFHELPQSAGRHIVVRSTCLPTHIVDARPPGGRRALVGSESAVPSWALHRLLQAIFAKREFLPEGDQPRGQERAIRRVLEGKDGVVLLPTGAGKSLIYQLAGLLMPGLTLVIDPLISLIEDQIDGLRRQGIDCAIGITSADTKAGTAEDKLAQIQAGDALFAFVSPERMQQQRFRDALRSMSIATPVNLLVVDEAHCVSEWGHDFRTSYLDIGRVLRHVTADEVGSPPPLLALTGTASRAVLKDMLIELSVDRADPEVVISPPHFDRPELRYAVVDSQSEALIPSLIGAINGLPARFSGTSGAPRTIGQFLQPRGEDSTCGIVFCQTVNGRKSVVEASHALSRALKIEAPLYSGTAPRGVADYDTLKRRNAERFKNNEVTLLVATKSYGMGIDKPNVRYVVHFGIPASIEAYYQEAGRAGRDRAESVCLIVHDGTARETIDWFHKRTFVGVDDEVRSVVAVLDALAPLESEKRTSVPFGRDRVQRERAIHRLKLLGLVRDYVLDWSNDRFDVKVNKISAGDVDMALANFVRRNQPGRVPAFERRMREDMPAELTERIISRARMMVEYVYETIVAARRRAVDEMERLANEGRSDEIIRDRILRYLELGRVANAVEELLDREPFQFSDWAALLDAVDGSDDAREWRGATIRMLESDPDNPGLLLGRGLAEAAVPAGDVTLFAASLESAFRSAASAYSVSEAEMADHAVWLMDWLGQRRPEWRALIYPVIERAIPAIADDVLERLEESALHNSASKPAELAIVLTRRLGRTSTRMHDFVIALQEDS